MTTQSAKTDADGEVMVKLDGEGVYLVRLVHMRRVNGEAAIDWESFWAALTFGMK